MTTQTADAALIDVRSMLLGRLGEWKQAPANKDNQRSYTDVMSYVGSLTLDDLLFLAGTAYTMMIDTSEEKPKEKAEVTEIAKTIEGMTEEEYAEEAKANVGKIRGLFLAYGSTLPESRRNQLTLFATKQVALTAGFVPRRAEMLTLIEYARYLAVVGKGLAKTMNQD